MDELYPDGIGLPAVLEKVDIGAQGRVILHYAPKTKLNGTVILTPDVDTKHMMIREWICTTSDFAFIAEASPECSYIPQANTAQ
ncbi:hypothetical protein [Kingella potus]|nr:hypothetical protein [Kingella potus]UOP01599.1 hypothetical protein LVJ84_05360 [Kingella potus]